jgi:GNAT superfamily N-acetyltransferase
MLDVRPISWEQIREVWEKQLWPDRQSPIKTHSSMQYLGGYDMSIYDYPVSFWGVECKDRIIAVISGFRTNPKLYRSRGIWIDPNYRFKGFSKHLFNTVGAQAYSEGCSAIWSFPRLSALPAYHAWGFRSTAEPQDDGEFGPNCYVIKEIAA